MQTAVTKQGKWVTLDVGTPVFEKGKLVGYYFYTWTNETYPHPEGGVAYYATRVYIPERDEDVRRARKQDWKAKQNTSN